MGGRSKKSKKPSATKAELLLENAIFFVDRSLGRQIGAALTGAGMSVRLHDDHFPQDTPDEEWIGQGAKLGWVVLTKDSAIKRKPREREAVLGSATAMFTLAHTNMTGQQMAETFIQNRLKMMRILKDTNRPFVAVVSISGIRVVLEKPAAQE